MTRNVTAIEDLADALGITLMNEAQAALPPRPRERHRAILSAFLDADAATTTAWIADQARLAGLDPEDALDHLARADLVHTAAGAVTVAYPFSGTPTPHRVELAGGPTVWAMCAADALGIPLMTGRAATITSTDPHTGDPIQVHWRDGSWRWEPAGTVMLVAGSTGCATAAEAACLHIHFFTRPEHAQAHLRANPGLSGAVYDHASAIEMGQTVFGPLLGR